MVDKARLEEMARMPQQAQVLVGRAQQAEQLVPEARAMWEVLLGLM
jgi:hypothetical protein